MPTQADLLEALREELILTGEVRKPPDAAAATVYPMFIEHKDGAPAPGELEGVQDNADMVITINAGGDVPSLPMQGFIRECTVDMYFRAAPGKNWLPMEVEPVFNEAIVDKWAWTMGGLYVLESTLWSGLQKIRQSPGDGTTWVVKYRFQIYRD